MSRYFYYQEAASLWSEIRKYISPTDVVVDIGPGIKPMSFFHPKIHFMVEPCAEYRAVLYERFRADKKVFVLSDFANVMLPCLANDFCDSVFMLDLIEHLTKEDGLLLLKHAERIAREQIVIFTPLGFMPQHMEDGELDGWGMHGVQYQEHRSGWLPDDFGQGWDFHICETFHAVDFRQETLKEPHGAFFAIKNIKGKAVAPLYNDTARLLANAMHVIQLQKKLLRHQA